MQLTLQLVAPESQSSSGRLTRSSTAVSCAKSTLRKYSTWSLLSGMIVTDELAGDHGAEDVVRALADRHQRRVAVKPLDLVFGGVAVSTVDTHGLERGGDADLGRVELRHPGLEVGAPAGVERGGRPPREEPRRLHLCRHVRQLQLDRLELRDGAAESVALARVGERAPRFRPPHRG